MYTGFFSNRKKRLVWVLSLVAAAAFVLTGCTDRKKPYNFLNSVWVCEKARACIAVTKRESRSYSYGEIELDGKVLPITMVYFNGTQGALLDFSKAHSSETIFTPQIELDKYLWRGYIAYGTTAFTLEKTFEEGFKYPLLSDDDLPLTFVRYNRTEEELLPLLAWDAEGNLREDFEPGGLLELGLDVYAQDPPEEKGGGFSLWDFWPDPFGVSDQRAPGASANGS